MDLGRYFHTLRYLRPIQFYSRLAQRLYRPRPNLSPPPPLRTPTGTLTPPLCRPRSLLGPTRFLFLNECRELTSPMDWDASEVPKLWRYNLHYFDDLTAVDAADRNDWHEALLDRWIAENPPGRGTGWEPYPLSVRIVNWVKRSLAGRPLSSDQISSLAVQARFLAEQIEWHLLGNHLLTNAKALIFAGFYFAGAEADRWRSTGLDILDDQLPEQILADGGHYERSPMYHSLMLEDLLDLINLHATYGVGTPGNWRPTVARMGGWLAAMTHPDGDIAFFNDAALDIAPAPADLAAYAGRLGIGFDAAGPRPTASGYGRLESADAVLLMDYAPVGPDFLPGHAHADTLSFEFSLGGRRLLVNSGTSVYGLGIERERQRGTAAHNTVRIDGFDSSEVWHGFRVARRARPFDIELGTNMAIASHDGYRRLPGHPVHRRRWHLECGRLEIEDEVSGTGHHQLEVYFHLHPDWRAEAISSHHFKLTSIDGSAAEIELDPSLQWRLEASTWHPRFGVTTNNVCIVGEREYGLPVNFTTQLIWPCAS